MKQNLLLINRTLSGLHPNSYRDPAWSLERYGSLKKSMVDNKPLEEQAENHIKSQLLKFGFNVIKPSFDKKGSNLIIIDKIVQPKLSKSNAG